MLIEELENMTRVEIQGQTWNGAKAVAALFPYAVWRERGGDKRMLGACSAVVRDQRGRKSMSQPIVRLLGEEDFNFPNWVVTLVSPDAQWERASTNAVTCWAAAALADPYTEELCQRVVDTLLQIASEDHLQPFIPVSIWTWLKKRPSLPLACHGRSMGRVDRVVRGVRELGDIEILESYFLLVWSEWDCNYWSGSLEEMHASIREDFCGIGMWRHREVLIKRLDHILGELDKGLEHFLQQVPGFTEYTILTARKQYGEHKELLLEVDGESLATLARTLLRLINTYTLLTQRMSTESHSAFICALPLPCL